MSCCGNLLNKFVLPAVYDEELSYYECLCELYQHFTELINSIDTDYDNILSEAKSYTDSSVNSLSSRLSVRIDSIANDMDSFDDDINVLEAKIKTLEADINTKISELYTIILNNKISVDNEFAEFKIWVEEYVKEHQGRVELKCVNPITGKIDTIQNVINAMYYTLNTGALNCTEWDNLTYTADKYDKLYMTAYTHDFMSRWALFNDLYLSMLSPFTGKKDTYEHIIYVLADMHRDALTATDYDDLELTATTYDGKNITAYYYDFYGNQSIK